MQKHSSRLVSSPQMQLGYCPLHQHTMYSLLDGVPSIKDIIKRCKEVNITRAAITDHGNGYGWTEWMKQTKEAGILGLCGIEFYVCQQHSTYQNPENKKHSHLILIAKNTVGYRQLVKMVSRSNRQSSFYGKNRLSLEEIAKYLDGNIIGICGHMGSTLWEVMIEEIKENEKDRRGVWHTRGDWKEKGKNYIEYFMRIFGPENFGVEIQTYDQGNGFKELVECNRELCRVTGAIPVATADGHYAWKHQAELQRILLCIQMNKTLARAMEGDADLGIFFETDKLYLPSREELKEWGNTDEEIDNTLKITERCEELDVFSAPKIPSTSIPKEYNRSIDYLTSLCRTGYTQRYPRNTREYAQKIGERVKCELEVIDECGLTDYFLLIHKIINWCKDNNILTNIRGSAAGCCINYLLGITHNDPIKYGLLFERFFNKGRVVINPDGTKTYNLPDTDIDVQSSQRQKVIQYLRDEFGYENVGQIVTFNMLKGRNSLKDVCKALGSVAEAEVNQITSLMPEEHIIDDDLRVLADDFGYRSIIQYCLQHMAQVFAPYAKLEPDGSISGPLAREFTIARNVEGVPRGIGIHAGGVVVNTTGISLEDSLPMVCTKKTHGIIAIDMHNVERYGTIKIDLLGSIELDKFQTMVTALNTGRYEVFE